MLKRFKLDRVLTVLICVTTLSLIDCLITRKSFLEYFSVCLYISMFLVFCMKLIDGLHNYNILLIVINFGYIIMSLFINGDIILNLISGIAGLILYTGELILFSLTEPIEDDDSQKYTKYRLYR